MKIIPAKEIVVLKEVTELESSSGIKMPIEKDRQNPITIGEVAYIGLGKKPFTFKEGDILVYRKYTESPTTIDGTEYNFIKFDDLMGGLENEI